VTARRSDRRRSTCSLGGVISLTAKLRNRLTPDLTFLVDAFQADEMPSVGASTIGVETNMGHAETKGGRPCARGEPDGVHGPNGQRNHGMHERPVITDISNRQRIGHREISPELAHDLEAVVRSPIGLPSGSHPRDSSLQYEGRSRTLTDGGSSRHRHTLKSPCDELVTRRA